ncbi:MAG: hypothetical protein ACI9G1_000916 [Pirellulaceae bacterium]
MLDVSERGREGRESYQREAQNSRNGRRIVLSAPIPFMAKYATPKSELNEALGRRNSGQRFVRHDVLQSHVSQCFAEFWFGEYLPRSGKIGDLHQHGRYDIAKQYVRVT